MSSSHSPKQTCTELALFCALFSSLLIGQLSAATYAINSDDDLEALTLVPGDEVVWENGGYADQQVDFNAEGTEANPIILRAETPGGVVFSGDSQLNIGGSHLIVEGFYWNGSLGSTGVIEFRKSGSTDFEDYATDCVLRNCALNGLATAGDSKSKWVMLYGTRNTVEFCSFLNKDSTGACVLVELANQGPERKAADHKILNNYFYNFSRKDGRTNDGDSEAIRIGESAFQAMEGGVLVQDNYFVQTNGENEIISNKSRNNTYLNNTFRRSRGALVLRHGSGAWIEGNYFLGEGSADTGGIRISDGNHVIINNYMEKLRGAIWNAAVVWKGGNASSGGTSNGYQYVDNVLFAFNTIYDASEPMAMNDRNDGGTAPTNVTMANNLFYSEKGELIVGEENLSADGITFVSTIMAGSEVGLTAAGINTSDPIMSLVDGLYRPSISGPAANTAEGRYSQVTVDVEGKVRPESGKDVGALEVSGATGSVSAAPITDDQIGSFVGSSFIDSSNSCDDCPDPGDADPGGGDGDGGGDDGDDGDDEYHAASGGTTDSGEGLLPSDDAYVSAGDVSGGNFGDREKLVVKDEGEYSEESLLKFDLSEVSGTVTSAVLRLKVRSTGPSSHLVFGVEDDTWSEDSVTWDARPARGNELDSLQMVAFDTWMEFDVTAFVNAEVQSDGVASFLIAGDAAVTINYYSTGTENRIDYPELLISTGDTQTWREFDVITEANGLWQVDTGGFLGQIWVDKDSGWLYEANLNSWLYIVPGDEIGPGAFIYIPVW